MKKSDLNILTPLYSPETLRVSGVSLFTLRTEFWISVYRTTLYQMQIFKWRSATHYKGRIGCAIKQPSFKTLLQHCSRSSAERYKDHAARTADWSNQLLPEVKGINPPKMDATTLKTRDTNDVTFLRTYKQHTSEF